MMNLLQNIKTGKSNFPPRILLYGSEGCGKSTFGANAPKPIFIDIEDGLGQIEVTKFPRAKSYSDVTAQLHALLNEKHEFQTLVLDSIDWLEGLIFEEVCVRFGVKNIEKVDGGYGKGYVHALNYWRDIVGLLDRLREERQMITLMIAHSKIKKCQLHLDFLEDVL